MCVGSKFAVKRDLGVLYDPPTTNGMRLVDGCQNRVNYREKPPETQDVDKLCWLTQDVVVLDVVF